MGSSSFASTGYTLQPPDPELSLYKALYLDCCMMMNIGLHEPAQHDQEPSSRPRRPRYELAFSWFAFDIFVDSKQVTEDSP